VQLAVVGVKVTVRFPVAAPFQSVVRFSAGIGSATVWSSFPGTVP